MNTKETIIRDYNDTDYREFWEGENKIVLNKIEKKFVQNLVSPANWMVDIGSGFGRLLPCYYEQSKNVVLVDYAVNLLQQAEQNYKQDNVYFVAANAYKLPFRNSAFDGGISVRMFHHLNTPEVFVKELSRILANDANFLLSYSNKRNFLRSVRKSSTAFKHGIEEYKEMLFGIHPAYFKTLMTKNQLQIRATDGTGFIDQVIGSNSTKEKILKKKLLAKFLLMTEKISDNTFGKVGLAPIHFARLKKTSDNKSSTQKISFDKLSDLLICPNCQSDKLVEETTGYTCSNCKKSYPKIGKIIDLRVQ